MKNKNFKLFEGDEQHGLGAAATARHQTLSLQMSSLMKDLYPHLTICETVDLKDPEPDIENPERRSKKYVEFDISVWQKKEDAGEREFDNDLDDCLVGIELEAKPSNRRYDLRKIDKSFSYSSTLREIFLFDFNRMNCIRFVRTNGIITRQDDCWFSETLGVDIRGFADIESHNELKSLMSETVSKYSIEFFSKWRNGKK